MSNKLLELCDHQDALSTQMQEDFQNLNLDGKALRARLAIYQKLLIKSTFAFREAIAASKEDTLPMETIK
jgi:capsule polysaccharide export protein KpsE/RkpR